MRRIDLDEFLRQNCIDRMEGKSCEECKHHVLEVSCERLMEQPTIDPVKHGKWIKRAKTNPDAELCSDYDWECSECGKMDTHNEKVEVKYCWNCGSRMDGEQR